MNFASINGQIIHKDQAVISVFDHGFLYADALYETIRIYDEKPVLLQEHLERLSLGAKELHISLPSIDELKIWIEALIKKNKVSHGRMRITLSRGVNQFDFSNTKNLQCIITLHPLHKKNNILHLITYTGERFLPHLKTTNINISIQSLLYAQEKGGNEGLLISKNGMIREGSFSNFFAIDFVNKNIFTAPQNTVLSGIMQGFIFRLLEKEGYKVFFKDFSIEEISELSCFISNSIIGMKQVSMINQIICKNSSIDMYCTDELFMHAL